MRDNVARVAEVRKSVGDDFPIMIDCYMALNVNYTVELARRVEPYNIKWIEEFLPPDDYAGYQEVKQKVSSTLLTTGEHEYTRYGFRQLLERKCAGETADHHSSHGSECGMCRCTPAGCDVGGRHHGVPADCGPRGRLRCARRAARYVGGTADRRRCVPNKRAGSSVYSYHMQYAFPNCPLAEARWPVLLPVHSLSCAGAVPHHESEGRRHCALLRKPVHRRTPPRWRVRVCVRGAHACVPPHLVPAQLHRPPQPPWLRRYAQQGGTRLAPSVPRRTPQGSARGRGERPQAAPRLSTPP
jgi:hypothetical protein